MTFLNPLLYKFVCELITTKFVYYRLFWLIPNLIIITYCLTEHAYKLRGSWTNVAVAGVVTVFIGAAINTYGCVYRGYPKAENQYKIWSWVVSADDYLLSQNNGEEVCVIVPRNFQSFARQYTLDINFALSRISSSAKIPGEDLSYIDLYNRVYDDDPDTLTEGDLALIKKLGTQVIVYGENRPKQNIFADYSSEEKENYTYIYLQ